MSIFETMISLYRQSGVVRIRGALACILFPTLLAGASCTGDQSDNPAGLLRRDSAGVAIVENRAADHPFPGEIVPLAELATPDNALTALPWGIAADPVAKRVYVADAAGNRVAVFDAEGAFVGQLGRAGEGPGEFGHASALAMAHCNGDSCQGSPGQAVSAYTDGAEVRSLRRQVAPITVARAMAVTGVQFGPGPYQGFMRQCGISAEEMVDAVGHAERLAPVAGLAVDPGGRLWVARRSNGLVPESIDVLDVDGAYLGTLDGPILPVAFLSRSRLVGIRVDMSTGQIRPSIYEVRGDGPGAAGADPAPAQVPGSRAGPNTRGTESADEGAVAAPESLPNPAGLREFRDCPACPLMVELPPGRYLMGRPDGEEELPGLIRRSQRTEFSRNAERPQLEVEIAYSVAMGKYEVTFNEWDHCVDAGGCTYRPTDRGFGRGRRPVIHVSRLDAEEYLAWLRDVTGEPYRLPSSAEWEYAARAGTTTAHWWGDELGNGRAVCDGCGSRRDDRSTAPVGSFPANPWGLHDMLSNVSEVVADCWHNTYDGHPSDGAPRLEAPAGWPDGECKRATWRGGAWPNFSWTVRATTRSGGNMGLGYRGDDPRVGGARGFRVARTVEPG